MDDVVVIGENLFHLCACSALDGPATEASLPRAGTTKGWTLSDGPFPDGAPNPFECPEHPGRRHFLFAC